MPEQDTNAVSFRPDWKLDFSAVPTPVNQLLLRVGVPVGEDQKPSDEIYITFGHIYPPAVIPLPDTGTFEVMGVEDNRAPVTVVGNFSLTRARAEEFRNVLTAWLDGTTAPTGKASRS